MLVGVAAGGGDDDGELSEAEADGDVEGVGEADGDEDAVGD